MRKSMIPMVFLLSTPLAAFAGETWSGAGEVYGRDGKRLGTYELTLTRTEAAKGVVKQVVTVKLPDGSVRETRCTMSGGGNGWGSVCEDGRRGGGMCLGDGMCLDYVADAEGAFSTTVAKDGEDRMRLVHTELKGGQAVRFLRETLSRVTE